MPTAKRLVEPLVPVDLPQCEAVRTHAYHNDTSDTDKSCKNRAKYVVDGKHLCRAHAGPAALQVLLRSGKRRRRKES